MNPAGFQYMKDAFQINLAIEDGIFHRCRNHSLRCQMDDNLKMVVGKDSVNSFFIADIAFNEFHSIRHVVPGPTGQIIKDDDIHIRHFFQLF